LHPHNNEKTEHFNGPAFISSCGCLTDDRALCPVFLLLIGLMENLRGDAAREFVESLKQADERE